MYLTTREMTKKTVAWFLIAVIALSSAITGQAPRAEAFELRKNRAFFWASFFYWHAPKSETFALLGTVEAFLGKKENRMTRHADVAVEPFPFRSSHFVAEPFERITLTSSSKTVSIVLPRSCGLYLQYLGTGYPSSPCTNLLDALQVAFGLNRLSSIFIDYWAKNVVTPVMAITGVDLNWLLQARR
jgi:hypothetical protein